MSLSLASPAPTIDAESFSVTLPATPANAVVKKASAEPPLDTALAAVNFHSGDATPFPPSSPEPRSRVKTIDVDLTLAMLAATMENAAATLVIAENCHRTVRPIIVTLDSVNAHSR